jgi:hypothetical protein
VSEQELREGLLAAVGDEPPMAFDPDALMQRARRDIKRRRALLGAGTATVAVAVAAVAVPAMLGVPRVGNTAGGGGPGPGGCPSVAVPEPGDPSEIVLPTPTPGVSYKVTVPSPGGKPTVATTTHRPSPQPSPPPLTTPMPPTSPAHPCATKPSEPSASPAPPTGPGPSSGKPPAADFPWPPPGVEKKHYTAAQLKERGAQMQKYLQEYFATAVVGATDVRVEEFGGEAAGAVSDGQTYLNAFVGYTLKGQRSAVDVAVFAPGEGPTPAQACEEGGCSVLPGKAGDHMVTTTISAGDQMTIVAVRHYRSDGAVVAISGYNYDPMGKTAIKPLPAMPVSVEQLTYLATQPQLGI